MASMPRNAKPSCVSIRRKAPSNDDGDIAITPGDLTKSELWQRITTDDKDEVMPPPKAHKTLTATQKETLKRWIEQGAPYQKHWAFEAPIKPPVPTLAAGE